MIFITNNPQETQALAPSIIEEIFKLPADQARVVAFEGELGAGKTTLIQALAQELGITETLRSPTFVIFKKYKVISDQGSVISDSDEKSRFGKNWSLKTEYSSLFLIHMDCYRIRDENDLNPLGFDEILSDPQNLVFIEWSERIDKALPPNRLVTHIDHTGRDQRKIEVTLR